MKGTKLSRTDRLAEGDGLGGANLCHVEEFSSLGEIWTHKPT